MPHYKLTAPNGKSYHGITTQSINRRMTGHRTWAKKGSKYPLHAAIRKYGFDAFKLEVLSESKDRDELHRLEVAAIARDDTFAPNGYNLTVGGDGTSGHVVSDQHRLAIGARMKGCWLDVEFAEMKRRESSERAKRLNADPEHKAKLQAASRAYWSNPENVAKRTEQVRKLRKTEPERFANLTVGLVRYNKSEEGRVKSRDTMTKMRAAQTFEERSAHSKKVRAATSEARKKYLAGLSDDERDAELAAFKARRSAETKAGRAAAKAARSLEEEVAVRERYRQAALRRTPEQREKLRLARIAAIEAKRKGS